MKKTQMQIMQEAIDKINAMSDDDFLNALVEAGVAEAASPFAFTEFMAFTDVKTSIVSRSSKEHKLCLSF
ncbi:hypothetical protein ACNFJN_05045 [Xenorhabdus budapestensis]|uniref:Uncharacterized protein n=1 Tax=Xenorhabdus budapestensis TaxID=290110 RepID=A0ABX7VJ52_XENBU|nr:hypothetical protein [Xenorhabdus budapestensis]QTL40663.1 hypothetical protein HGO23_04615 [Xenorhabdus budapestensis]